MVFPLLLRGLLISWRQDKAAENCQAHILENILITFRMPGHLPQIPLRV